MKKETLQKLTTVLGRAQRGDREAVNAVRRCRARAAAGDERAKVAFNTLRVLHWMGREGKEKYARLEAFYGRCLHGDPQSRAQLRDIVTRAKGGDEGAIRTFRVLKSVHHKYKASAWSGPGEPKIGGYGMPNIHRAGIDIPGLGNIPIAPSYPTPGINPYGGGPPPGLLPLTPQAVAGILQVIQQARVAPSPWQIPGLPGLPAVPGYPGGGGDFFMSKAPPEEVPYSAPAPNTTSSSSPQGIRSFSQAQASAPIRSFAQTSATPTAPYDYSGAPPPGVPCPKWDLAKRMGQSPAILNALRIQCEQAAGYQRPMPYIR